MNICEDIKIGLNQAIEYEKGTIKAKKTRMLVKPVRFFSAKEVKEIRQGAHMTQALFAKYLGVSVKTVEAWEAGTNRPNGSAARLLEITRDDPEFPSKIGIVFRKTE